MIRFRQQDIKATIDFDIEYYGFDNIIPNKRLDQFAQEAIDELEPYRVKLKLKLAELLAKKASEYINEEL